MRVVHYRSLTVILYLHKITFLISVQLNDVRNKLQDTFHDICELASRKTKSLGTELQRPRSASKQIYRVNVSGEIVDYDCRPVFVPFGDHVVSQLNDRKLSTKILITFPRSCLSGRELVRSQ
jgi:hypothetical protein